MDRVKVIGGGLAGSEAAWQLAERGFKVELFEMRPAIMTSAHKTDRLAEIVCSNSFKSEELSNAHGLLKAELRELGSLLIEIAYKTRVAAGAALAVDREQFSAMVTNVLSTHPNIDILEKEVKNLEVNYPTIVATGPLTSSDLHREIQNVVGDENLYFYDSISPIVSSDSIDYSQAFLASRYGKGEGDDYINCPLSPDQYHRFYNELINAEVFAGHDFDKIKYFEGCQPVEVVARTGRDTLRFGIMKPVGLSDPLIGGMPYAVVQLRRENSAGSCHNIVGFQTRLTIPEQRRVFKMIPALRNAEFLRYGSMHRNTFVNTPSVLTSFLQPRISQVRNGSLSHYDLKLFFAGQLVGGEGYTESIATGLLSAINLGRLLSGKQMVIPPATTMIGGLLRYITEAESMNFQPMNANFGLIPPLEPGPRKKKEIREQTSERALGDLRTWIGHTEVLSNVDANDVLEVLP